jgi:hypothetical protein
VGTTVSFNKSFSSKSIQLAFFHTTTTKQLGLWAYFAMENLEYTKVQIIRLEKESRDQVKMQEFCPQKKILYKNAFTQMQLTLRGYSPEMENPCLLLPRKYKYSQNCSLLLKEIVS